MMHRGAFASEAGPPPRFSLHDLRTAVNSVERMREKYATSGAPSPAPSPLPPIPRVAPSPLPEQDMRFRWGPSYLTGHA